MTGSLGPVSLAAYAKRVLVYAASYMRCPFALSCEVEMIA